MQINAEKLAVESMERIFEITSKIDKKDFRKALKKKFPWLIDPSMIAVKVLGFTKMKIKHKAVEEMEQ